MKLNIKAFSFASAIIWCFAIIVCSIVYKITGTYAKSCLDVLVSIYPWTSLSSKGLILLCIWSFFDGIMFGAIFGWLYNLMVKE